MASKPWYTTSDLISAIKRKISFPVYQSTFTEQDLIDFLNEEMAISQVPNIMEYHEEYLVYRVDVPLKSNQSRYSIPYRAIGMKLRDVKYVDISGSLFDTTRVSPDDKAYFQSVGTNSSSYAYYLEGNDIVLTPGITDSPQGYLAFYIFIRPNQLVSNDRAGIIQSFTKTITVDVTTLSPGDTVKIDTVTFTAVSGTAGTNEFQIAAGSTQTAANLASAIASNGIASADNGVPASTACRVYYDVLGIDFETSNASALAVQAAQGIYFASDLPSIFSDGVMIDLLQEKPGHKIYKYDIKIPIGGLISTRIVNLPNNSLMSFNGNQLGMSFMSLEPGDYICLANEAIIPQIPPDLHNVLAERAGSRILASIGDTAGAQASEQKIADMEKRTGTLIDSRVDSSPQKITNRRSLLHRNKGGWGRSF